MTRFTIKQPLVTEKSTGLGASGKYTFLVDQSANAPEIARAVQERYNVAVIAVHVINTKPKRRRLGRSVGVKPGYKKAIVTLKKGQKLDILPQ